ncbi:MAG: glycoside hydrolase family protein [Nitrososphaera sp.]|nr:glycoside hydrolase family protein [Nitrososphaera sp.]
MNASPIVAELVKVYEPFRSVISDGLVGWGHTVVGEEEASLAGTITLEVAKALLAQDILNADYKLSKTLRVRLPDIFQHQYDALVSLFLNNRSLLHSFLLKAIASKNDAHIAREFVKWGEATKSAIRRAAESRLFFTGSFLE